MADSDATVGVVAPLALSTAKFRDLGIPINYKICRLVFCMITDHEMICILLPRGR